MRPCYLEFCGVNSFSEPAAVDFTHLLEFGIFGIFGDTGSGKSTVLDCINFALYGEVPRMPSKNVFDMINYRSERAYVRFEFEIFYEGKRRRYRVERELKRRGVGHVAKVYERTGEDLVALADGVRESRALIEKIVGLEQGDFEKCIALPQGEFAQFVKAQRGDRLKLVSRLFDLEAYGEKLVKRANAEYARLFAARNVTEAKLEPYREIGEETVRALKEEIARLTEEEKAGAEALRFAREREADVTERNKRRKEAERVAQRLRELNARRGEMDLLESELERLAHAEAACRARRELDEAELALDGAREERERSRKELAEAEERSQRLSPQDEEKIDEEIAKLTEERAAAEQSETVARRIAEREKRLTEARREYAAEAERFKGFSYEREKEALEERLGALGGGDFLAFAEEYGKERLLRKEYAVFAGELNDILKEFPETAPKTAPLAEKYEKLSSGEDGAALKEAFEARERERAECRQKLIDLEKRNGLVVSSRAKMQQLQTEGTRLKAEIEEWRGSLRAGLPSKEELEKRLSLLKKEKREGAEARERAQSALSRAQTGSARASEKCAAAEAAAKNAETRLQDALSRGGFSSFGSAKEVFSRFGGGGDAKERIKAFREEYAALDARRKELGEDFSGGTEENVLLAREETARLEREQTERVQRLALKRDEFLRGEKALGKKREIEEEYARISRETETAERLKKLLEGNKFMEFVAEEYLQNIAQNASGRLLSLTEGRYFLRYDGGFFVGDNLNGGSLRAVYTLSGGEVFLVSLSLALALSAEICQKSLRPIEFFFLDEGFGTLDGKLVDTVMDSLEKLKGEHFSIGIISHVEELKHRIERKLTVEKATDRHGSRIHA